jgi:protocatechuate 3,4-dioxygenase beta subunit
MKLINRRSFILALSGLSTSVFAFDRPTIGTVVEGQRDSLSCDNTTVAVSRIADRVVAPVDFTSNVGCAALENSIEGPYFMCAPTNPGKSIVGGLAGQPLTVAIRVLDKSCTPVPDAFVDIWSCGPDGRYSGYDVSPDEPVGPGRGGHVRPTNPQRFARGVLRTDADGIAEFDTIYPGFYAGRPIHIHFKVHVGNKSFLTSQAFLPEDLNLRVLQLSPYNAPRSIRRILVPEDPLKRILGERIGSFPTFSVVNRGTKMVALLNVGVMTI